LTESPAVDHFRRVSFTALLRRALVLCLSFAGRSSRAELAVTFIAAMVFVPLGTMALLLARVPTGSWSILALNLASMVPFPALLTRRLHDQARSGWLILPALFGFSLWLLRSVTAAAQGIDSRIALDRWIWPLDWIAIAANMAMIALLVLPGTRGPNRFGPDPRDPA
jgi:uncharacterized membrane protein YhaH (DUF805 family)